MTISEAPCRRCNNREAECHGRCSAYKNWREELDEFRDKRGKESEQESFLNRPVKRSRRK
jgi:hypothetical protein